MCGFAGIVHSDSGHAVDPDLLRRMRDELRHRGPDGEGLFVDGPVGLAHRRLAIVDVSSAGHQPMANEDGSVWIAFNGEIYNHARLRPSLEAAGHRYRSRTDTETIVHLYEEMGERAVDRLHGMFALAVWDARRRTLLLARDRLGIKPLYYAWTGRELVFASEIKAILASGCVRAEFNREVLPEYLSTRFVSGEATFFKGIRKLLPGHLLTWSRDQGVQTKCYWRLPSPAGESDDTPLSEMARDLRQRLEGAVERHLMSDVPLGVFLSGGLDSSALAAMTTGVRNRLGADRDRLKTFSVGFAEKEASELPYARAVARAIGSEHREVTVSPGEFFDALPRLLWHEDEPIAFPSSVPLYFVSRLAREHVKVVLTGEGADELFLGYNRYRVTHWNDRMGGRYAAVLPRGARNAVRATLAAVPGRIGRVSKRTFLALDPGVRSLFLENFSVFDEGHRRAVLAAGAGERDPYAVQLKCFAEAEGDLLGRLSRVDLQTYLHELLMKQDQMSMAASIESRVPFLDDEIVEHVVGLPSSAKVKGWQTKAVFREAVRDAIPHEILTRKKMGFPVPLGGWLGGPFWPVVEEFVLGERAQARGLFDRSAVARLADEHRTGGMHGDRLWLLVNLEIWQRIFCEGDDPDAVMSHAHSVGEDGRAVAGHDRRASTEPADRVGAVPAA